MATTELDDLFIPGKGWVKVDQDGMIHTPDDVMDEIFKGLFKGLEDVTKPKTTDVTADFIHEAPKRLQ